MDLKSLIIKSDALLVKGDAPVTIKNPTYIIHLPIADTNQISSTLINIVVCAVLMLHYAYVIKKYGWILEKTNQTPYITTSR